MEFPSLNSGERGRKPVQKKEGERRNNIILRFFEKATKNYLKYVYILNEVLGSQYCLQSHRLTKSPVLGISARGFFFFFF